MNCIPVSMPAELNTLHIPENWKNQTHYKLQNWNTNIIHNSDNSYHKILYWDSNIHSENVVFYPYVWNNPYVK